jgi:chromosome segregation ATPase
MSIEEMREKARKLGIEVSEEADEQEILDLLDEKEKELNAKKSDPKENDAEYLKAELKKVIDQRDRAKKDKRSLEARLKELEDTKTNSVSVDEFKTLKSELEELRNLKKEMDKIREEEELKKLDTHEREKVSIRKEMDALRLELEKELTSAKENLSKKEEALSKKESEIKTLRTSKLEADVIREAAKHNVFSPSQIFRLTKEDFVWNDNLGRFEHVVRDEKGKIVDEMSVSERIKSFLEDKENENLIRSSVKTDSMRTTQTNNVDNKKTTLTSDKYDPKDPDIIHGADMKGLSVEDYIETLVMRDNKINKKT